MAVLAHAQTLAPPRQPNRGHAEPAIAASVGEIIRASPCKKRQTAKRYPHKACRVRRKFRRERKIHRSESGATARHWHFVPRGTARHTLFRRPVHRQRSPYSFSATRGSPESPGKMDEPRK